MKKNKKSKTKSVEENKFVPRVSLMFVIPIIFIWFYVVLSNYYKSNTINFFIWQQYFSLKEFGSFSILSYFNFLKNLPSLFFAFLIFFSAYFVGKKLAELFKFNFSDVTEKLLVSLVLGFFCLTPFYFIIGILGFFYKNLLVGITLFICLVAVIELKFKKNVEHKIVIEIPKLDGIEKLWVLLTFLLFFVVLVGCFSPEIFYDSLVYHIAKPNFWLNSHTIVPEKGKVIHNFYTGNSSIIYAIGLSFLDETVCKSIHFLFYLATGLTIFLMGKKFFNPKTGIVSTLLFFTIPYSGILSYRSAPEMMLAFFETMAIFAILYWMQQEQQNKQWFIISAISCGVGIGTKYITFYCLFVILIVIFLYILIEKKDIGYAISSCIKYALISSAVPVFWFLYNIYYTGNPVYPFFGEYIGFEKMINVNADPSLRMFSLKGWISNLLNIITSVWIVSMGKYEEAFIGVTVLLFIPMFLIFKPKFKLIKYLFIYAVIYWSIWRVVHLLYIRYCISLFPLLCFLCGVYLVNSDISLWVRKIMYWILTFVIISNICFVMSIQKFANDPLGVVLGLQSKFDYLNTMKPTYPNPYYSVADWINKNLPEDVLVYMFNEYRSYYIKRKVVMSDLSCISPIAMWSNQAKDEDDLYRIVKKEGVTHIFLNLPEVKRLAGYDIVIFEKRGFENWLKFWDKYVEEVYKDIADISLPDRGIFSMKKQNSQWWQIYSSDPKNYVYLYKILSEEEIKLIKEGKLEHKKPINFFLMKELYSEPRWEKILKDVAEKYVSY